MPTQPYYIIDPQTGKKTRVPGVTTVLSQLGWGQDGLLYWANTAGLDGLTLEEARKPACDVGTVTHACIEAQLTGQPMPDISQLDEHSRSAVGKTLSAWDAWTNLHKFQPLSSELSLVSDSLRYGGTLDAALTLGETSIVDWKTGKAVYGKDLCQVVAYGKLWEEVHPDKPIKRYHILRLGKTDASFHHHSWDAQALEPCWEVFKTCLRMRELQKVVEAMT